MKQIKKLAIEYSESVGGDSEEQIPAYEAGFRKAREMAVDESVRYFSDGKEIGPMSWRIRNLGESEE